jgi:non-specific serine/threonine protein kinase
LLPRPPRWHGGIAKDGRPARWERRDFNGASAQALEALSLCEELEDPRGMAWSFDVFAGLLAAGGHPDGAARLWGASDRLLESVGGFLSPEIRWIRERHFTSVKQSLGAESFEAARAAGRALALDHAIALVRQQALLFG